MKLTMIGHCTVLLEMSGKKLLTDPYFAVGRRWPYERVVAPARTREEMVDVDVVLLSHLHWDHVDEEYLQLLSADVPVLAPSPVSLGARVGQRVVRMEPWFSQSFGEVTVTAVPGGAYKI
mgnify:FL=1